MRRNRWSGSNGITGQVHRNTHTALDTALTAIEGKKEEPERVSEGDLVKEQVRTTLAEFKFDILKWVVLVIVGLLALFYAIISNRLGDVRDEFKRSIQEMKDSIKEDIKSLRSDMQNIGASGKTIINTKKK